MTGRYDEEAPRGRPWGASFLRFQGAGNALLAVQSCMNRALFGDLQSLVGPDLVAPYAAGRSLTSVPTTIGHLLGVDDGWRSGGLALPGLAERYERVVLLLVDGLGYAQLHAQMAVDDRGLADLLARFGASGDLGEPLTTVAPSTTAVATTVLAGNGAAPAELGFLGYTQLMPQLGLVANMLFWQPAWSSGRRKGDLETWGLAPEEALPTPTIYQVLAGAGVPSTTLHPADIARSPLSRVQSAGARVDGYVGWVDMLVRLAAHLEESAGRRGYTYAYFPDFDSLMHRDGPATATYAPLLESFVAGLRRTLETLSPKARRSTLLLITADHGHRAVPGSEASYLDQEPTLTQRLAWREGGEPRHVYLYARAGEVGELLAAAQASLGERFRVLLGKEALAAGLYGDPAHLHPEAEQRVGDVVLLARRGACLWDKRAERAPLGMHGSLTAEEMLVPLLALPLDAN